MGGKAIARWTVRRPSGLGKCLRPFADLEGNTSDCPLSDPEPAFNNPNQAFLRGSIPRWPPGLARLLKREDNSRLPRRVGQYSDLEGWTGQVIPLT